MIQANKHVKNIIAIGMLAICSILLTPHVSLAENEKVCTGSDACFEQRISIEGKELDLQGVSLFRYWGFRVYSAAFYSESKVTSIEDALAPARKYLVLRYHRSLGKKDIIENSDYILNKNPSNSLKDLKEKLDLLYAAFQDVNDGDRFALSYVPKNGTTLYFNGIQKVTIPGENLQRAYFGIWLSSHSVDKGFTERLLSN